MSKLLMDLAMEFIVQGMSDHSLDGVLPCRPRPSFYL